jgi:short subunit dehydrogenase-like uncharacterized protein
MARRPHDIVVFGASGFTGEWIAVALARAAADSGGFTFAIAGRDRTKLASVVQRISREVPGFDASALPVVIADVRDAASLAAMTSAARVVISAAGPFRFLGEPVVQACIASGTDYCDITGEPEFMERIELKYDAAAKAAGIVIVSSCGFDSVPSDVGAIFAVDRARSMGYVRS